jgi:hypothetical protein
MNCILGFLDELLCDINDITASYNANISLSLCFLHRYLSAVNPKTITEKTIYLNLLTNQKNPQIFLDKCFDVFVM